jgi:hypothetical protein
MCLLRMRRALMPRWGKVDEKGCECATDECGRLEMNAEGVEVRL